MAARSEQFVDSIANLKRILKADGIALLESENYSEIGVDDLLPILKRLHEVIVTARKEIDIVSLSDSIDSCTISLGVLTQSHMPKRIYLQTFIDRILLFLQLALKDVVYARCEKKKPLIVLNRNCQQKFASKIPLLIDLCSVLVKIQKLPQMTVHKLMFVGLSPFFIKNIPEEITKNSLKLLKNIFIEYKLLRKSIIDDLWNHTNKTDFITEKIQTWTWLLLELIRSLEKIDRKDQNKLIDHVIATIMNGKIVEKFDVFLSDLKTICENPRFPIASTLLNVIFGKLIENTLNVSENHIIRIKSLDYLNDIIIGYLRNGKNFEKLEKYLQVIGTLINDNKSLIRIRSIKKLIAIGEIRPEIIDRSISCESIQNLLFDRSISVRESTIELIGNLIMNLDKSIVDQYYRSIIDRIKDISVSVRKKVIDLLRKICLKYPNSDQLIEISLNLLVRINDEAAVVKNLLGFFNEIFLIASPDLITKKTNQIIDLVKNCNENQLGSFKILIGKTDQKLTEIIDCLIMFLKSQHFDRESILLILNLIGKNRPELLIDHYDYLQSIFTCQYTSNFVVINLGGILETLVPLVKNSNFTNLEIDCIKLIYTQDKKIVASAISLLAIIINYSNNYKLITDCFEAHYQHLLSRKTSGNEKFILRSLYIIGLIFNNFDYSDKYDKKLNFDHLLEVLLFYSYCDNFDIKRESIETIGKICLRNWQLMLLPNLQKLYADALKTQLKSQILINFDVFLTNYESLIGSNRLNEKIDEIPSVIVQKFWLDILSLFTDPDLDVRKNSFLLIRKIFNQGFINYQQIVPYLIAMSTDQDPSISNQSERLLIDIQSKSPKSLSGQINLSLFSSYRLQKNQQVNSIRGFRLVDQKPKSLLNYFYFVQRNNKKQRENLISSMINHFTPNADLDYLIYLGDNLAYFPYVTYAEPLFVIKKIDVIVSNLGDRYLADFRKFLLEPNSDFDQDRECRQSVLARLPQDTKPLILCTLEARFCHLLLIVNEFLMETYEIDTNSLNLYVGGAKKMFDRQIVGRKNSIFDLDPVIRSLREPDHFENCDHLVDAYMDFKRLAMNLDENDDDDDEAEIVGRKLKKSKF